MKLLCSLFYAKMNAALAKFLSIDEVLCNKDVFPLIPLLLRLELTLK